MMIPDKGIWFSNGARMAFSKTTGYGIRALAYLANHTGARRRELQEIADHEGIPPVYLRKVLGALRRQRLLRSVKGIHGGYELARPPETITLWEVFQILDPEPFRFDQCLLGHGLCEDRPPCPLCGEWQTLNRQIESLLRTKTIAGMVNN